MSRRIGMSVGPRTADSNGIRNSDGDRQHGEHLLRPGRQDLRLLLVGGVEVRAEEHRSHPPDLWGAEQAVRFDEQSDDHHDVRDDQRVAGAEHRVWPDRYWPAKISASPTMSPPTSAPCTESRPPRITAGRARNATSATSPVDGPGLGDRRRCGEHAAERREHGTGTPRDREHAPDVDALGHRRFLVLGDRSHGDAHPRPVEEVHGDERRAGRDHDGDVRPVELDAADPEVLVPHGTFERRGSRS